MKFLYYIIIFKYAYIVPYLERLKRNGTDFSQKNQVILLEVEISENSPYVDYQQVLQEEYAKWVEQEVLFPPFLLLNMELNTLKKDFLDQLGWYIIKNEEKLLEEMIEKKKCILEKKIKKSSLIYEELDNCFFRGNDISELSQNGKII